MLEVGEDFVVLNMVQNVLANNVFKKFTGNTSQKNWSVVFRQNSVAFPENWYNFRFLKKCALEKHFWRYADALRFAVGLYIIIVYMVPRNSIQFVKYEHYQISSGGQASLGFSKWSIIQDDKRLCDGSAYLTVAYLYLGSSIGKNDLSNN